ncbi:hypothetical protein IFM89_013311 [Coptis chinensis]|uniref:RING-type domain-containing protein n=1 Tax=Coptis chinensis TaxID=261450 RepID=A0A835HE27_9MAGN|nr:hypothetical protein IFM89_013311 [Coptis chinensis]
MGFDNECILNIQSLAGEYFCPVCRLLVYPNEALQSQCTHLYCKPCLTYVVSTTHACPYDGYLVTEADSKPLVELNKALAETIGKIAVHCLYHRSGCTWQGELSECITHCTGCAFGNSPVVCNRCGTQIVHRQVQEHAQNCPGVQPQAQQAEGGQDATTATGAATTSEQNQASTQAGASNSQAQAAQGVVAPTSGQVHGQQQPQLYLQTQPHQQLQVQPQFQQRPQVPQHQQPRPQHPQTQQPTHPYPQQQHHTLTQMQSQSQVRPQTQPQPPLSNSVTGHQSYPQPQPSQQVPSGPPQQHPINMHLQQQGATHPLPQLPGQMQAQFPQQQVVQMRPPHSHVPPQGQRPNMPPAQQLVHPQAQQLNQPVLQYPGTQPPHLNVAQQAYGHSHHPQVFVGQTTGLVQNTPQQPISLIHQQAMQSQLRPQVPSSTLPQASQAQNVPLSRGLQSHQSQNYAGRPLLANHGVPHQPFQPSQVGHTGGVQQYPVRPNIRPQSSAPVHGAKTPVSSVEPTMQPELQAEVSLKKNDVKDENVLPTPSSQGAGLIESRLGKSENELKAMDGNDKSVNESEAKISHPNSDVKEISESSQALEKDRVSSSQDGSDEPIVKNMVKEEPTVKSESSAGGMSAETAVKDQNSIPYNAQNRDDNSQLEDKEIQNDVRKSISSNQAEIVNEKGAKLQNDSVESQVKLASQGYERNNKQALSLDRGPLQQQPHQLHGPTYERIAHSRPGPSQVHGSSFLQPGHAVSVSDKQQLPMIHGPPHMQDRVQWPPVADQMSQQNLPPHQMQLPGPPPTHMRPQGHNILGNVPLQGQPLGPPGSFTHPLANRPLSSFHPELPPGGGIEPGSSSSFMRGPGPFGPQGHLSTNLPPHHAGGLQTQGDPMGGPAFRGAPPGAFDSQGSITRMVPPHGQQLPGNPMDSELFAQKRSGYFDSRQPDMHLPGAADRVSFGQPSSMQSDIMKMNGDSARVLSGGVFGLQEDRFKRFPEERYKQLPEDGFIRREFFDDLKRLPRPAHLDPEHVSRESYFSSSRPLDRAPHGFTGDARLIMDGTVNASASRLLPPHPDIHRSASESGRLRINGLLPSRSPGREYPDIPPSRFGRIEDIDGRETRAYGERSRLFDLPPDGNPFLESRFPILPSHLRRGEPDIPGNLRVGERFHLRGGDLVGPDMLPSHLRNGGYGNYPNPLRLGDVGGQGNLPSHLRIGDSGEGESLDHSRKRKQGSMGWCRICKVDCETVEGLEMHSQTREHQKMAMDMVLNIKKDNAKKQKLSSEDHISHDGDTNKARKTNIENHEN